MANQPKELELAGTAFTDNRAVRIMEEVRQNITKSGMGVTVIGSGMTVRFGKGKRMVHVSFQVTSITDSEVLDEDFGDEDK